MWYFTSDNDQRVLYITQENTEIVVGRCDLTGIFNLQDDSSISRKHAAISALEDKLILQDLGSRYGTYINENIETKKPLDPHEKIILKDADIIKFGKLNNVWKLHKITFVTCTSTLKGENLNNLKISLEKIGGLWKNDWDETCTYLTMPAITLTIKVVLALVQGLYIVTPEYWNKCCEAINKKTRLPDPEQFTPEVIESTLNKDSVTFLPSSDRKYLFQGKTFIFFSRRQLDTYKMILIKASASVALLSESKLTKTMLCANNVVVVQYTATQETQTQRDQINDIINYLKSKGRRIIPESEIGLAVLYNSTTKHCNPEFNLTSQVIQKPTANDESTKTNCILAKETQDIPLNVNQQEVEIDESLMSINDNVLTNTKNIHTDNQHKRKLDQNSPAIDEGPAKRMAIKNISESNDSEELFNFIEKPQEMNNEKKLNFARPQKRKVAQEGNEDDLFQFLPEGEEKEKSNGKKSISTGEMDNDDTDVDCSRVKKPRLDTANIKKEFTPVRGIKVKDLMHNATWKSCDQITVKSIKKEDEDHELKEKMDNLDLGTTVVKVREDLIKSERNPIVIETSNGNVKNFKKFKKIWPIKMQVTIIPKSSNSNTLVNESLRNHTVDSNNVQQM